MATWNKDEKAWERQPKESARAYEAFDLYLKMGPERSLRKVGQELGKSNTLISRWSSAWNWQERCRDYDNYLKRQELEEQRKIVMQASQEVKSIDKLEEKQLEEYQLEASRAENEERMEMLTMTK